MKESLNSKSRGQSVNKIPRADGSWDTLQSKCWTTDAPAASAAQSDRMLDRIRPLDVNPARSRLLVAPPPKKIAESKSESKRFARDVDGVQAALPSLNRPRSDSLICDPLISSQPICGESICRGARREHSGVNAVSPESRSFGPVSLLGLSLGQGRSGGWRVGRFSGRGP